MSPSVPSPDSTRAGCSVNFLKGSSVKGPVEARASDFRPILGSLYDCVSLFNYFAIDIDGEVNKNACLAGVCDISGST